MADADAHADIVVAEMRGQRSEAIVTSAAASCLHPHLAGDKIELERRRLEGETVWVLKARGRDWSWLGAARKYAKGKSHRWEDIEKSIGEAMARGDRRP